MTTEQKYKYKFTLSIGFVGANKSTVMEYDYEPSEQELQEDWQAWANNHIEGGWELQ